MVDQALNDEREQMIPSRETLEVEFKSDRSKCPDDDIFEACVALANTNGGDLYLGVEDDGTPTGLHKSHLRSTTVGAYIANNTMPPMSVRAEIICAECPVLRVSVPKARTCLYATTKGRTMRRQLKADGTPESVVMFPQDIMSRLTAMQVLDYSARVLDETSIDDLDPANGESPSDAGQIRRRRQSEISF